tara:strand:- start:201 stop:719 length:519 start_codon:yes stop_codon:yes gene_type:complete
MSFSSFKNSKLIFESFRKFVNEQDEVDLLAGEEEEVFEMPPEPERPTYGSQEEYTAAADAAESSLAVSDQEAETARLARKAAADKRSEETDVLIPDELDTSFETANPDALSRATTAYMAIGSPGNAGLSIPIALADLYNSGDKEAYRLLKSKVRQDESGMYGFIPQEKPTDF